MDTVIDNETLSTLEGAGSCLKCRRVLPRLVESAPVYFKQGFVTCSQCGDRVDLWQAALDSAIHLSGHGASALVSFGAVQTSFVMPMEPWKYYEVELTKLGVAHDARILRRIYTGQTGDMHALEWHTNAPPLRFPGTTLRLVGIPSCGEPASGTGRVGVSVVWIRSEESEKWSYLVTAFETAAAGDYAPSLVFAQSAVEISVMRVIEKKFQQHVPEKRVKRFTNYSRALNVVLPYMCGEATISQMPAAVHKALDELRDKRNEIMHQWATVTTVSPQEAMKGLCAAAFGFEYMRYVEPLLLNRP
jgi:hypothetical protein